MSRSYVKGQGHVFVGVSKFTKLFPSIVEKIIVRIGVSACLLLDPFQRCSRSKSKVVRNTALRLMQFCTHIQRDSTASMHNAQRCLSIVGMPVCSFVCYILASYQDDSQNRLTKSSRFCQIKFIQEFERVHPVEALNDSRGVKVVISPYINYNHLQCVSLMATVYP